MTDAFYVADGELLVATESTRGPWDPGAQHAGPPAALLGAALERLPEAEDFQLGRLTFEILGPVPIAPASVAARIARPGRRVQMLEAELSVDGEVRMRVRAWRLRRAEVAIPPAAHVSPPPPPHPGEAGAGDYFPGAERRGYHTAMEVRFAAGAFMELGPATAWLRMREPLLAGEQPSPLQRTLIAADVGNGISASLDFRRYVFVNVDLTVQLERLPVGEWICVDAVTLPQPSGIGTAESVLFDQRGRIGRAMQTLLISER